MREYDVSSILTPACSYRITHMLHQHWHQRSYSYRDVPRPDSGLLLITQGQIDFHFENTLLHAVSGDLLFLPKGSHYEARMASAEDYLINFQIEGSPLPAVPVRLLSGVPSGYIDLFRQIIETKLRGSQHSFLTQSNFYLLLDTIVKDRSKASIDSIPSKALALLLDPREFSIQAIAGACGVSESGLRSIFHRAYDVSPLQYRLNNKIAKAQYLLESTDLSVSEITGALNFYDDAYFCKVFRERVGCSPRAYAKRQKL